MGKERDYGKEIDAMKEDIAKMMKMLEQSVGRVGEIRSDEEPRESYGGEKVGHVQKMVNMHPDPHIMALMSECEDACGGSGETGRITYLGVFSSGGNQSSWIKKCSGTDELLEMAESGACERILTCFGSQEKLSILLALLRQPMTVAQLVEKLHFGSTGQVYHHLKPLFANNLVREDDRRKGCYEIVPHNVQGIIMILAGIGDILKNPYDDPNPIAKSGSVTAE